MKSINEQLNELYASKWEALSEALLESVEGGAPKKPQNPMLLYVGDEKAWQNADLRVMIFGQETNDWEGYFSTDKPIAHLCDVYDRFFNKEGYRKHGGCFWNGVARLKKMIGEKFPQRQISYLWNNIVKVGKAYEKGRPPKYMYDIERTLFRVIPDEVSILKPNLAIFLTGNSYDNLIRENFGQVGYAAIPPFGEKQLARLSIPAAETLGSAFRTYHPGYLFRHGINAYFSAIIGEITL
ncbi:MAG: hypothetical protein LBG47_02725 [Prevotellaceae bacterium]|nr:hypothetical protein [Prevotellaceae bacterium]